jgi:IclR family acetate operon transcriptional repressor
MARVARDTDVQTIDRAVAILDAFTSNSPYLGATEIARRTGLSRSTAHRLIGSLLKHEFLRKDGNGKYALGSHLFGFAATITMVGMVDLARPVMERLRDRTGETVGLNVIQGRTRVVVDQVESHHALRRTYTEIGRPLPIHQGAPGKALLAFAPHEVKNAVLSSSLTAATDQTIVDPTELRAELARITERGYALSFSERISGVHTAAAPVLNAQGLAVACLSVTGPAARLPAKPLHDAAKATVTAAAELATRLGTIASTRDR